MTTTGRTFRSAAVLALALAAAPAQDAPEKPGRLLGAGLRIREIPPPAEGLAGEPNAVRGADGKTWLIWIARRPAQRLALCLSSLEGEEWSDVRTVADGEDWLADPANLPSLAALPDGTLAAHWLVKLDRQDRACGIRVACSRDGGKTWPRSFWLHTDLSATEHGYATLVPYDAQGFTGLWLDGRAGARPDNMTLRAVVFDAQGRLGEEKILDPRVCECCAPAALNLGGTVVAVYRDRSEEEIRDLGIVLGRNASEWSAPAPVHEDRWENPGCPLNGPALAAQGAQAAVAWFTKSRDGRPRLLLARSEDGGKTFGAPLTVAERWTFGRPSLVLLDDGSAIVSWLEEVDRVAELRLRKIGIDGSMTMPVSAAKVLSAQSSGFPRLARAGQGALLTWIDPVRGPRVRTALVE